MKSTFQEQIVAQIKRSPMSCYRICQRSQELADVDGGPVIWQSEMTRFRSGAIGMSCRKLNRLGEILNLTVQVRKAKAPG